jgi:protein CpxP
MIMTKFKILAGSLAVAAILLFQTNNVSAQTPAPAPGGKAIPQGNSDEMIARQAKAKTSKMKTDLNLTDDQSTKVEALIKDNETKRMTIRKNTSLSKDDQRKQMKDLNTEYNTKLSALLTKEQNDKMAQLKAAQAEKRKEMMDKNKANQSTTPPATK